MLIFKFDQMSIVSGTRSLTSVECDSVDDVEEEDVALSFDQVNLENIDVIEAVDEFQYLLSNCSPEMICSQLWNVFCAHIGNGIFDDGHHSSRLIDIYELCHIRFYELLETFKQFKYYDEKVLSHLDGRKVPDVFIDYVEVKALKDPSKKFLKDHPQCARLPQAQIRIRQFGCFVWSDFGKVRATVRNDFNVYWKECNLRKGVTPSGVNNTSGLLRAIRWKSYIASAWEKLELSIKNKKSYAS